MRTAALMTMSAVLTLTLTGTVSAHHSGAAVDRSRTLSIEGEVKEWNWANPHTWLQVYAPHEADDKTVWSFEATAATLLARQGYRRTTMAPGDKVTVTFNPYRGGEPGGGLQGVKLGDGTTLGRTAED